MPWGAGAGAVLSSVLAPDAPDMSGQNDAARQSAQVGADQLAWDKERYRETAPDRQRATQIAFDTAQQQLEASRDQSRLATEYADYNRSTFRPLEQGIVSDAAGYDTPQRREAQAAKATADVEMSLAGQRGISNRELEASGAMPGSGKQLAMQGVMDINAAKLKAGAANQARTQVETIGAARKMDAASLGRNLPSNQATSAGIAMRQGNSAVTNAAGTGNIAAGGNTIMNSGFDGAIRGYGAAGNIYAGLNRAQMGLYEQQSRGAGAVGGALGDLAGQYIQKM